MLSLTIWWAAILLEGIILFRSLRAGLVTRYLSFYVYILGMFLSDVLLYLLLRLKPGSYDKWAWYSAFLIVFLGCGILLEIFRHVLSPYAGAEKFARVVGYVLFGAILCFAIIYPILAPDVSVARSAYLKIQRDFLVSQAVLLFGLLQVILYYRIAIGRNLKGMILGYGQCLGVTAIAFALRTYVGHSFQTAWNLVQQFSYLAALATWLVALWSFYPNPVPDTGVEREADYEILAARTRGLVSSTGTQLARVERS